VPVEAASGRRCIAPTGPGQRPQQLSRPPRTQRTSFKHPLEQGPPRAPLGRATAGSPARRSLRRSRQSRPARDPARRRRRRPETAGGAAPPRHVQSCSWFQSGRSRPSSCSSTGRQSPKGAVLAGPAPLPHTSAYCRHQHTCVQGAQGMARLAPHTYFGLCVLLVAPEAAPLWGTAAHLKPAPAHPVRGRVARERAVHATGIDTGPGLLRLRSCHRLLDLRQNPALLGVQRFQAPPLSRPGVSAVRDFTRLSYKVRTLPQPSWGCAVSSAYLSISFLTVFSHNSAICQSTPKSLAALVRCCPPDAWQKQACAVRLHCLTVMAACPGVLLAASF